MNVGPGSNPGQVTKKVTILFEDHRAYADLTQSVGWSLVSPTSKITQPCRGTTRTDPEADGPWFELRQRQQTTTLAEGGLSGRVRATYDEAAARWSLKIRPIEVPPDRQHHPAPSDEQLAQQTPPPQHDATAERPE